MGTPSHSHDKVVRGSGTQFIDLVKNTYRVLLSRGLKGCYVYCQDPETAKYLLSRTEGLQFERRIAPALTKSQTITKVAAETARPFQDCLPLYDLCIAVGEFGEFQMPELEAVEWVRLPSGLKATADMFVARVTGESMNRIIPNGSWCVFRSNPAGSRDGRIVVAQLRDYADPDGGGSFTISLPPLPSLVRGKEREEGNEQSFEPEGRNTTSRFVCGKLQTDRRPSQ
ncbi:MAG: S24 family peptidase [Pirellulaceae bacterium]